uniref:Uncharacterized protein n=1 Tax=Rhizophora mucronata TaxID=61149 RepID=A0A2P2QVG0_RHIMU
MGSKPLICDTTKTDHKFDTADPDILQINNKPNILN